MSKSPIVGRPETASEATELESYLEEFSIMELEDRLELTDRCNGNCDCDVKELEPAEPAPTPPSAGR